jgi:hypothetical protein
VSEPPWEDGQGWRILDAAGNVVAAGAPIQIEEHFGLPGEEELDG